VRSRLRSTGTKLRSTGIGTVLLSMLMLLAVAAPAAARTNLPVGTNADYQLGGDASAPPGVGIVERDRTSRPLAGHYNICYVNGFQTQTDEQPFWKKHPRLILRRHGHRVVDSAWGEWLLDVRTKKKRQRLARIVGAWTQGCKAQGFDAVEYDNLDSFTRSRGLIKQRQSVAYARLLVARAHADGLAAGQKNLAGFDGRRVGYDFAIAEECGRYRECGDYTKFFGRRVIVVEYRRTDFDWTCTHYGASLPIELRDLDLTPGGVHDWC
jgi:Glycoside-hydrolase family GH114